MGILDRIFHRGHEAAGADVAERAALAHDEAADAYSDDIERTRGMRESEQQQARAQDEADRRAAENMTAEGDPWD
ncbi:hypothetical protein PUR71_23615 [Streptomyces sp. SP17BM10]|uniref:hypothetical protein n=1 Tax=Streptomyces sp. SP17BM10 TaxID=3002530 RepID=UPI002E79F429|nr:hypothetical protein [Streptomyces sp. SP17BM10]MEE1785866.1 hypothetical protein [Streptomyces sp. SP17BM10]